MLWVHAKFFVFANLKVTAISRVLQDYTDVIYCILKWVSYRKMQAAGVQRALDERMQW